MQIDSGSSINTIRKCFGQQRGNWHIFEQFIAADNFKMTSVAITIEPNKDNPIIPNSFGRIER